jgi:hypothetical protein
VVLPPPAVSPVASSSPLDDPSKVLPMTTIIERPATPTTFVPPAPRFRRRATGAAVVVGGLLTAAGFAATVWETAPGKLAYLDSLVGRPAAQPDRGRPAAGIVPMLLALAGMTRSRWRIGGNIGLALSLPGAFAVTGMLITDFYDLAIRQSLPAEQAAAVSDAAEELPLAGLVGGPLIMLTFVGMTVLGVAAWRAGFFHWAMVLPVPASVATIALPVGAVPGITQGALLGLYMVLVGVAAWRMTDEEWVTGLRGPLNP